MNYKIKKNIFILALFIIILLIPIPSNLRIGGIVLNPYRIMVLIYTLIIFFGNTMILSKKENFLVGRYLLLFYFLIGLGACFICTSPWIIMKDSIKELVELSLGLMTVYVLITLIKDDKSLKGSLVTIKYILFISTIIGVYEIISGNHLGASIFNDKNAINDYKNAYDNLPNIYQATGFFYGENDFGTFSGILFPSLFVSNNTKIQKVISVFTGIGIIFILLKNDANIVLVSLAIGLSMYAFFYFIKKYGYRKTFIRLLIIFTVLLLAGFLFKGYIKKLSFFNSVITQLNNFKVGHNSMYYRIHIYWDAINASINNFLIGYGPDSFKNYFAVNKSISGLVDPHGLIFELLINYGLIGVLIFFGLLIELCIKNVKKYLKTYQKSNLIIFSILIILFFASFSPSSFIGYSYQWAVYGIALSAISIKRKEIGHNG